MTFLKPLLVCAIFFTASAVKAQLVLGTGPNNAAPGCTIPSGANNCRDPATISGDVVNILNYSSFAAAVATGKTILFPANSATQAGNGGYMIVKNNLIFEAGATLGCDGNLALSLMGSVTAPRSQIFSGCQPSFWGQAGRTAVGFPEWWGAIGDYAGNGPGTGTDNTVPIQSAINSGIGVIQMSSSAAYRITDTLTVQVGCSILGYGWGQSHIYLDDPTGLKDVIYVKATYNSQTGTYTSIGNVIISELEIRRLQQAKGSVQGAFTYTSGSGVRPGDTFTLSGGTFSSAAVIKAATTQVTAASVNNAGSGGTSGVQIVTGTTGAGTFFQANVTIGSSGGIQSVNYIASTGAYTVNPTSLASEPVTGAGLSNAKLSVSMGARDLTVVTPGSYTTGANGLVTASSTSGAGVGQQFWIMYAGPSAIHLEDVYYARVENDMLGSSMDWNGVTLESKYVGSASNYILGNRIFSNKNDGILVD